MTGVKLNDWDPLLNRQYLGDYVIIEAGRLGVASNRWWVWLRTGPTGMPPGRGEVIEMHDFECKADAEVFYDQVVAAHGPRYTTANPPIRTYRPETPLPRPTIVDVTLHSIATIGILIGVVAVLVALALVVFR